MTPEARLQNQSGEWASLPLRPETPWLPEDLANALTQAASHPSCPAQLQRAAELLASEAFHPGPQLRLPHTPESQARMEQRLELKAQALTRDLLRGSILDSIWARSRNAPAGSRSPEQIRDDELAAERSRLDFACSPMKKQRWIHAPRPDCVRWTPDAGKASLLPASDAQALVERCARLAEIAALLPAAARQARALGAAIPGSLTAQVRKLGAGPQSAAKAIAVPFNPACEYLSRECFAIYAQTGSKKGFATSKTYELKPDLASARLFPTAEQAKLHGKRHFKDYALVSIDIAPLRFEPQGSPGELSDLQAAINAREALEIDRAVERADADRLKAELARRDGASGGRKPPGKPARL